MSFASRLVLPLCCLFLAGALGLQAAGGGSGPPIGDARRPPGDPGLVEFTDDEGNRVLRPAQAPAHRLAHHVHRRGPAGPGGAGAAGRGEPLRRGPGRVQRVRPDRRDRPPAGPAARGDPVPSSRPGLRGQLERRSGGPAAARGRAAGVPDRHRLHGGPDREKIRKNGARRRGAGRRGEAGFDAWTAASRTSSGGWPPCLPAAGSRSWTTRPGGPPWAGAPPGTRWSRGRGCGTPPTGLPVDSWGQVPLSKEKLIELDPDILVLPGWVYGKPRGAADFYRQVTSDPALRGLKAVRSRRVLRMPENLRATTSQYIVDAIEFLARAAYPELWRRAVKTPPDAGARPAGRRPGRRRAARSRGRRGARAAGLAAAPGRLPPGFPRRGPAAPAGESRSSWPSACPGCWPRCWSVRRWPPAAW